MELKDEIKFLNARIAKYQSYGNKVRLETKALFAEIMDRVLDLYGDVNIPIPENDRCLVHCFDSHGDEIIIYPHSISIKGDGSLKIQGNGYGTECISVFSNIIAFDDVFDYTYMCCMLMSYIDSVENGTVDIIKFDDIHKGDVFSFDLYGHETVAVVIKEKGGYEHNKEMIGLCVQGKINPISFVCGSDNYHFFIKNLHRVPEMMKELFDNVSSKYNEYKNNLNVFTFDDFKAAYYCGILFGYGETDIVSLAERFYEDEGEKVSDFVLSFAKGMMDRDELIKKQ